MSFSHVEVIKKTAKLKLWGSVWAVRRASHASGCTILRSEKPEFLRVIRDAGDVSSAEIFVASNLGKIHQDGYLHLELRSGSGCMLPQRAVIVEVFVVKSRGAIADPFSLAIEADKTFKYKIFTQSTWRKVAIKLSAEAYVGAELVVRCRLEGWANSKSTVNNYVDIKDICWRAAKSTMLLGDLVASGYHDVIFPQARYLASSVTDKLLVSFSSLSIPEYKYNTLDYWYGSDSSRLIVNDAACQWYLKGVFGLGAHVDAVASGIKQVYQASGAKELSCYGVSMGGYGAALYGCLLKADRILAFNAETKLLRPNSRSAKFLKTIVGIDPKYFDLKNLLTAYRGSAWFGYSQHDVTDEESYQIVQSYQSKVDVFYINSKHELGDFLALYNFAVLFVEHGIKALEQHPTEV